MEIKIHDIVQSELAIFHNEGLETYEKIAEAIENGLQVTLSFEGIERCSTQFLNAAIGKLYIVYQKEKIDKSLRFNYSDLKSLDKKIQEVRENALDQQYNSWIASATA